jgi:hypothetical protein
MNRAIGLSFACLAALGVALACVDTSPLDYEEPPPVVLPEGGAGDGQAASACRECVVGETSLCPEAYQACASDERCAQLLECILTTGCLALPQIQDRIPCSQPCFDEIGLNTQTDPVIGLVLPINVCTQDDGPCGPSCIAQ